MENKNIFNNEEVKCIRKMFKLASLTKYSLIAIWINFVPLIFLIINNFIRFENNVSRNFLGKYLYSAICIMAILLIVWAVVYIILKKNLTNNKIWQNILEKMDNGKIVNTEIEGINSNIKSIIPAYLLGNLISLSKELKKVGNTIKAISSIAVMTLIIKSCSTIMQFIKKISKTYNIPLKFNSKLYFTLFILPAVIIIIFDISSTISDIQNGNNAQNNTINSLKENCEQKSYCNSISSFKDAITIEFNEEPHIYSNLRLNENKKIKSISTYFDYNKNSKKEDIIYDVNTKLEQLNDLINKSNVACEYDFLCKKYQLSNEFIDKFYNMNYDDLEAYDRIEYEYELENKYSANTYVYIKGDEYSNPTDIITIGFILDETFFISSADESDD